MINYRGLDILFTSFGAVTSDDLFCDKEQALFDFYEANAKRYSKALDIGANIGVHSLLMARNGWSVRAFEPDPEHWRNLFTNIERNYATGIAVYNHALSDCSGEAQFVRVKGNLTANHLKGDKVPYGEFEEITIDVRDCRSRFAWADFAKIDCEGGEARLLLTTTEETWEHLDAMVEVGNTKNADAIYRHLRGRVPMWAQRNAWRQVETLDDMPKHHSEQALFIGHKPPFAALQHLPEKV